MVPSCVIETLVTASAAGRRSRLGDYLAPRLGPFGGRGEKTDETQTRRPRWSSSPFGMYRAECSRDRYRSHRNLRSGPAGPGSEPGSLLPNFYGRPRGAGGLVARWPHSDRSHGIDRGLLDPFVSDSGGAGDRSLSGQLSPRQACAGTQKRCSRLPVVAVFALGGIAARLLSTGGCHLPPAFAAAPPRGFGGNGGRARAAHAKNAQPDEPATASRAERSDRTKRAGHPGCDPGRRTQSPGAGPTAGPAGQSQPRNHREIAGRRLSAGAFVYSAAVAPSLSSLSNPDRGV